MSGFAFFPPQFTLTNSSGRPYAGAVAQFFRAGTSTGLTVYTDASLATPHGTSVTASSTGVFPPVFIDPEGGDYKVSFFTSAGSLIRTVDNLPATPVTASAIGLALYPRTTAEIAAGVTPSSYYEAPGTPERYGASGNGTADDTTAVQAAVTVAANGGGAVSFKAGKTYRTTAAITLPVTSSRILIQGNGATLNAAHTGDGIVLTATNENYGGHTVENLKITGPNVQYPSSAAELAGTSTGAGLRYGSSSDTSNAAVGYNVVVSNVEIRGFLYGVYMRATMLGKFYGLIVRFNQYGIYVDSGQANANDFYGCTVRENRVAGVYSSGTTGGSLTNATQNRFWGGIIESNVPYRSDNPAGYSGGYRTARDTTLVSGGMGVVLLNSYDWSFYDTYFENQNFDVWLGDSSDSNNFVFTRHGNGNNGRIGGFMFTGAGVVNNKVIGACQIGSNATDINLVTDHADHSRNQFVDTEGFNFIDAQMVGVPYVRNNAKNQAGGGTSAGQLGVPVFAVVDDVSEGTAPGQMDGIGTATATLYAYGHGELAFGSVVAAAGGNTTITTIDVGTMRNCFLILRNYQTTRSVIIKHDGATGPIVLSAGSDLTLSTNNQTAVFWVNSLGHLVQIN